MADDLTKNLKARLQNLDDIDDGMRAVHAEIAQGRPGLFLGKGANGHFALIVGHTKAQALAGGVCFGIPLSPVNLKQLRERIDALLSGKEAEAFPIRINNGN